jgi:hypothetical protein
VSDEVELNPYYGPVEVKDEKGAIVCSVGHAEIFQLDGPPMAWNAAGQLYETQLFVYHAKTQEELEDFGRAKVIRAFLDWATGVIEAENFYSIEWRARPKMEVAECRDETATILDKETGEARTGVEVLQRVSIRCRLIAKTHFRARK